MGIVFDKVAERVFELLKGQSYQLSLYDDTGTRVYEPETARMFFAMPVKMMVNIVDDSDDSVIRVNINKKQNVEDIKGLLNKLRQTASHFGLLFTVRTYAKELKPKDFAFLVNKTNESVGLERLESYIGKTITEDTARWAKIFMKMDQATGGSLRGDSVYLEQAERWTTQSVDPQALTEDDVVLSDIINRINNGAGIPFRSAIQEQLDGFMAMVKGKSMNEDWKDRMASSGDSWENYVNNGFDVDDFIDEMLKDLIGGTEVVGPDEQEDLDHYLATDADVTRQISSYVSRDTDGQIEDAGDAPEFLDQVYLALEARGIHIPPMEKSAVKEVEDFDTWVENFDPDTLFKNQKLKEANALKAKQREVEALRAKVAEAKANRANMERAIFKENKDKLFGIAHQIVENQKDPLEIQRITATLNEGQLKDMQDIVVDVWSKSIADRVNAILEDIIEVKTLTKQRIAESKKNSRTVMLTEDADINMYRSLAGLQPIIMQPAPAEQPAMVPPLETGMSTNQDMPDHKQKLMQDIEFLLGKLGADPEILNRISDDGGSALIYVTWDSNDQRCDAEKRLAAMGHRPANDYWLGSNTSEIPLGDYSEFNVTEAFEDEKAPGHEVFMQEPYDNQKAEEADHLASNLGIDYQFFYPTLANGLIFRCRDAEEAQTLIAELADAGIELYSKQDEGRLEIKHFDDDGEETMKIVDESTLKKRLSEKNPEHPAVHSTNNGWKIFKKGNHFFVKKGDQSKLFKDAPYASVLSWTDRKTPAMVGMAEDTDPTKLQGWYDGKKGNPRQRKEERADQSKYDAAFRKGKAQDAEEERTVEESTLVEFNDSFDRYSYNEDPLGNVVVHDIQTGKLVYLQGEDAAELMGHIQINDLDLPQNAVKLQGLLGQYEHVMESINAEISEKLTRKDPIEKWIADFQKSTHPNFKGKSKEKRKAMAIAAYKGRQESEEDDTEEKPKGKDGKDFLVEDYETGKFYLYSDTSILTNYGAFPKLFDANKRIGEMDDQESTGIRICYFDGENFRPVNGTKIKRTDLNGKPLPALNKKEEIKEKAMPTDYDAHLASVLKNVGCSVSLPSNPDEAWTIDGETYDNAVDFRQAATELAEVLGQQIDETSFEDEANKFKDFKEPDHMEQDLRKQIASDRQKRLDKRNKIQGKDVNY